MKTRGVQRLFGISLLATCATLVACSQQSVKNPTSPALVKTALGTGGVLVEPLNLDCQSKLGSASARCESGTGTSCSICRVPPSSSYGGAQDFCHKTVASNVASCLSVNAADADRAPASDPVPVIVFTTVHRLNYRIGSANWDLGRACLYRKAPGAATYPGCVNFATGSEIFVDMVPSPATGGPIRQPITVAD